jgi:hypothetical protein
LTLLKGLVLCLLLANVGYFLWARGIDTAPQAPAQSAPGSLRLASEAGQGNLATGSAAAAGGAIAVPKGVAADSSATNNGVAATGGITADNGTPANSALTAGSSAPDVVPPDAGEAGKPALLSNLQRCISVGPFRDVAEAAHAATTLRGGGYDPRQRVADGDVWAGVWVYLPLPSSRAAGDQILAKLKTGGIDDALEMPGPTEGSVISLGLYSEPKRAQARVAQAQALGFNPGVADRKRTGNVYWIDIDLKPTDSLLNPADLQGESGRIVRLEVRACPSAPGAAP